MLKLVSIKSNICNLEELLLYSTLFSFCKASLRILQARNQISSLQKNWEKSKNEEEYHVNLMSSRKTRMNSSVSIELTAQSSSQRSRLVWLDFWLNVQTGERANKGKEKQFSNAPGKPRCSKGERAGGSEANEMTEYVHTSEKALLLHSCEAINELVTKFPRYQ